MHFYNKNYSYESRYKQFTTNNDGFVSYDKYNDLNNNSYFEGKKYLFSSTCSWPRRVMHRTWIKLNNTYHCDFHERFKEI